MTIKTITTEQLAELTWTIESVETDGHELEQHEECVGCDAEGEPEMEARYNSWLCGTCTLRCVEHPEITYTIEWMAQGGRETLADAYEFEIDLNEGADNVLDTGNIEIVDEDGDAVVPYIAAREVYAEQEVEWEAEVRKHLPTMPEAETIDDIDEDNDMETIELARDNGPDVRFQGEQIASASSWHYEGPRNTRWTELTLYRTSGGKLVCHEVGRTLWQGERDRRAVHVADTEAEIIDAVGFGRLAKELYDEAGIDHAEEIE